MPKKKTPTGTAQVVTGRTYQPHKGPESYPSTTLFLGGMTKEACAAAVEWLKKNICNERISVTCGPDNEAGGFGLGLEINLTPSNVVDAVFRQAVVFAEREPKADEKIRFVKGIEYTVQSVYEDNGQKYIDMRDRHGVLQTWGFVVDSEKVR